MNNHNKSPLSKSYTMGLNKFTDLSELEFYRNYLNVYVPQAIAYVATKNLKKEGKDAKETSLGNGVFVGVNENIVIDWSCHTMQVIDKGLCGSSYVISPLQTLQTMSKMYNIGRTLTKLSIQQILECDTGIKNKFLSSCSSGFHTTTYQYIRNFGVGQNQPQYYYNRKTINQATVGQCNSQIIRTKKYIKSKILISGSKRIDHGDCKEVVNVLKSRVMTVGIVGKYGMQFYQRGMYVLAKDKSVGSGGAMEIDMSVTLVGYHPDKGYYVKNSWGSDWGMNGFAYVAENTGVCSYATYPIFMQENWMKSSPAYCT